MDTSSLTSLSVPLARSGRNYAPVKPLISLLENKKPNLKSPSKFEQSVREWYTMKLNYEKASRDEMVAMAQLVALFRKGNQLLQRRPYGIGYYVRPIQNDDTYRQTAMNLMTFHSQVSESKLNAANPNVNMRAGDDTPEAIAAAQACRPVVDNYENEWYTSKFTRREAIRLLTDGMFIHQVRWNPFKGGYQVAQRSITQKEVEVSPGEGQCADCDFQGEADDFQPVDYGFQCPQCGSQATDVKPAVSQSIAQIGMGQQKPVGEPEIISSSFAAWHWDLTKDLECSSWAIKRQYITQGAINLMLGDVTLPTSASSGDYGLDVLHALAYGGQPFQGVSRTTIYGHPSDWNSRPTMVEAWLSPEDQAVIECDEGDTVCGVKMPKGKLSDFFKGQPICIVGLNDMAVIVGTYANESHQREVITSQWFMDAESGVGRGLEDLAGVQKRYNAVDGQVYQGLAMTATPAVLLDKSILKEDDGKYLFRPGQNIDVNLALLPPNTKLSDAFFIGNPGNVSQQYIQYGSVYLQQMATITSLSVEFGDSQLPIDNRTATGAQLTAALANSLYGPMLMSKGESRVSIAKKIIELQAKYGIAGRFFPGQGNAKGRYVSSADLRGKVIFELQENSYLPITPFSQQTDIRVAVEALGGAQGFLLLKAQEPAMFRQLLKPFNVKIDSEDDDDVSTLCLGRLEQMKQSLQMGVTDPAMLIQMLQPPVSQYEPKHKEKKTWWSDWLDLQSAQESPLVLRQCAEQMYVLHQNLDAQRQMPDAANQGLIQGIGAAAAQAPSAMGAQALGIGQDGGSSGVDQQAQQQHEADQQDQDRELEAAQHLSSQQHEKQLKAMELAGQLAVTEQQGKNAVESAKIAGDNAVRVAKAKPKPKPKAA